MNFNEANIMEKCLQINTIKYVQTKHGLIKPFYVLKYGKI